jgi:Fe-S cluster biogenesis protein NfuA
MSMLTLRLGIERIIQERVPEIVHVEAVAPDEFEWPEIEPLDDEGDVSP